MNVGDGVAMLVRADAGGLGIQSYEIWRHLQPSTTIVMRLPDPRGHEDVGVYDGAPQTIPGWDMAARKAVRSCRLLLSIEGTYAYPGPRRCAVIANPELWRPDHPQLIDRTAVHTPWERTRVRPLPTVLPYPMPVDRVEVREPAPGWYHPAAPAMLDRNGTGFLLRALERCREPHEVFIRSDDPPPWGPIPRQQIGRCRVWWEQSRTIDYRNAYPDHCGALVLPRRYGGNCLPAYEAACMGWPVVMPDLAPQAGWPFVATTPVGKCKRRQMKGGPVAVWDPSPDGIAQAMDALAVDPSRRAALSTAARCWAEAHAWPQIAGVWAEWLA
jgi:hypothetical protein